MDRRKKALNRIVDQGILPTYYHPDAEVSVQVLRALYNAGYRVVEYNNLSEDTALDNFLHIRRVVETELKDLQVGVGTVKSKIDATEFINEGADFIISPGLSKEVAVVADRNDLLWVPTCMTSSEILMAEDLGAHLVRLFPAILLGPTYVASVRELFPTLLFIATGGIETREDELRHWFRGGISSVSVGSGLIRSDLLEAGDYTTIESSAREALQVMGRVRER